MNKKSNSFPLDDLVTFTRGVTFSRKDQFVGESGIGILRSHNVVFSKNKVSLHNIMNVSREVKVTEKQRLKQSDILISMANSKEQTGKLGIQKTNTDFYAGGFMAIIRAKKEVLPYFLYLNLCMERFKLFVAERSQGTTSIWNITFNRIKDFSILLPPFAEQKQITSLFQSIDDTIEQTENQEQNLRRLVKRLIDDFVNKQQFESLLNDKKLQPVQWKDCVVKMYRKTDPEADGIQRIVTGRHMKSDDFKIRSWGTVGEKALGPAFHVRFEPGDILYGSRRTYLRKVSHADFTGVCASTTYVCQANVELLVQNLLKHIMLSDHFTQYSIGKSKGSTNPFINWTDLHDYTFHLPDLATQKQIAKILDECLAVAEALHTQTTTLTTLKHQLLNEILG